MALPVKIVSYFGVREEYKFQTTKTEVSGFPPSPQGLRRGKQCSPLPLRFRRDLRQVSVLLFFSLPPATLIKQSQKAKSAL
jgi:hypothetical protein